MPKRFRHDNVVLTEKQQQLQPRHVRGFLLRQLTYDEETMKGATMTDNFKIIYRILKALEAGLDIDDPTDAPYSAKTLGISENRRNKIVCMMQDEGYVSGVDHVFYYDGTEVVDTSNMAITIKGLEYLHDNSTMQKMAKAAKGIIDVIS